jgi:hypothetical protein
MTLQHCMKRMRHVLFLNTSHELHVSIFGKLTNYTTELYTQSKQAATHSQYNTMFVGTQWFMQMHPDINVPNRLPPETCTASHSIE